MSTKLSSQESQQRIEQVEKRLKAILAAQEDGVLGALQQVWVDINRPEALRLQHCLEEFDDLRREIQRGERTLGVLSAEQLRLFAQTARAVADVVDKIVTTFEEMEASAPKVDSDDMPPF